MAFGLTWRFAPGKTPRVFINKLDRMQAALKEVNLNVWEHINRELERMVLEGIEDQLSDKKNTPATVAKKRQQAAAGTPLQRSYSDFLPGKAAFVSTYGKQTGFFFETMQRGAPLGSQRFLIRQTLSTADVQNGLLLWGIALPDFWKSYPTFIFDGRSGSLSGGPGVISLDQSDLEIIRMLLIKNYFMPALAGQFRGIGGGAS